MIDLKVSEERLLALRPLPKAHTLLVPLHRPASRTSTLDSRFPRGGTISTRRRPGPSGGRPRFRTSPSSFSPWFSSTPPFDTPVPPQTLPPPPPPPLLPRPPPPHPPRRRTTPRIRRTTAPSRATASSSALTRSTTSSRRAGSCQVQTDRAETRPSEVRRRSIRGSSTRTRSSPAVPSSPFLPRPGTSTRGCSRSASIETWCVLHRALLT